MTSPMASHRWLGPATVVSPLIMTFLPTRVSGAALWEKGMASTREGYADHVARTSGLLPLPPKKGAVR